MRSIATLVRRVAVAVGLAGMAVLAPASADTAAAAPPRLRPEKALRAKLSETEIRCLGLVEAATQDARMAKIAHYRSWTDSEQFVSPKADCHVKDLVAWMADDTASQELREKARDALMDSVARSLNPDLMHSEKGKSKRAPFCIRYLVPLLDNANDVTRRFANDVLDNFWYPTDKDIRLYNPQNRATSRAAMAAWNKYLSAK